VRSQLFKDFYFTATRPAAYLNHIRWQRRLRSELPPSLRKGQDGQVWLNIGSGHAPHPAFVNIEGNATRRPDMWLDIRNGLPFRTGTVDAIYTCHVLEHLYWADLLSLIPECFRVLRSGGGLRMLVPSLEQAIAAYNRGDSSWFADFPTSYSSLGGRFANFLFCDGQHRLAFDFSLATELLEPAGFVDLKSGHPRASKVFPPQVLAELEPVTGHIETSLVVEARKPDGTA
jgi:prepilin-type processing-associated H-X9-DG protein